MIFLLFLAIYIPPPFYFFKNGLASASVSPTLDNTKTITSIPNLLHLPKDSKDEITEEYLYRKV